MILTTIENERLLLLCLFIFESICISGNTVDVSRIYNCRNGTVITGHGTFFSHASGSWSRSNWKSNESSPPPLLLPPRSPSPAVHRRPVPFQCITIVNSIWIAAKLDRTVNLVRMMVRFREFVVRFIQPNHIDCSCIIFSPFPCPWFIVLRTVYYLYLYCKNSGQLADQNRF